MSKIWLGRAFLPKIHFLQTNKKARGMGSQLFGPRANGKSGPSRRGKAGFLCGKFLDCAVEAKAQRCGLHDRKRERPML
jgi:hypothetical protein